MNNLQIISRPEKSEYVSYYETYVSLTKSDDILSVLSENKIETQKLLAEITEEKALFRYAEGKWSVKELLGHIIDAERIFAYRALRFARNDKTEIEGFDQDPYIENADFDNCQFTDLIAEFAFVRDANILMFQNLPEEAWMRSGIASENSVTVRALAYMIAGHELHHIDILKERYLD
jgi:uncharacterized damage-inducible protein DinB